MAHQLCVTTPAKSSWMNLGDRIRRGVKWLVVGNLGNQLLTFAFGIVLARLLVPEHFGMIVTLSALTGFVGMFASAGMGQSLVRAKDVTTEDFDAVFTMQLSIGVLIYAGFFVSAPWVARFLQDPLYANLLRVSALSFVLRPFSLIRLAWLNREMDYRRRTLVDVSSGLVTGVSSVVMALAGWGVWSLTVSGLVGALTSNVLLRRATPLRPRLNFSIGAARRHSAYGFKITTSDFLAYLLEQTINVILGRLAGPAMVGLYNKADSLARMPNRALTPAVGQTVLRALSQVQDDLDKSRYIFHRTITLLTVYIYPFLIGLWWVAEPLVGLVYGPKWLPCVPPLRIIVLIALVRPLNTCCWTVLAAQNRLVPHLIGQAVGLVILIVSSLVGLNWGLEGVAWASVVTATYFTLYTYILVCRALSTGPRALWAAIAPALALSSILFGVLAAAHAALKAFLNGYPWLYLAGMILIGAAVYACAFLLLPIPALRTEVERWRGKLAGMFGARRTPSS